MINELWNDVEEDFADEVHGNLCRIVSAPDDQIRELLYDYIEDIFPNKESNK